MASKFEKVHDDVARNAQRWTLREEFLDTHHLRQINYGNLVLRREAHLFLTHGVIVSVMFLLVFWLASANWNNLMALTGMFRSDDIQKVKCYEIVTNVTQLPPPPPIAPPEPKQACPTTAPVQAPPNVGKIKKVAEAPPDQTMATQKEIRQANLQGSGQSSSDNCEPVALEACQIPPTRIREPVLRYPEMARIANIEGRVFIRVLIGEEGRALKTEIVKRVPADCMMFDKEALRIAMESVYTAGIQNGKKVRVWMTFPIRFSLHENG